MYMHHNNKRSQANEQFLYHLFPRTQAHTHKQKKKGKKKKREKFQAILESKREPSYTCVRALPNDPLTIALGWRWWVDGHRVWAITEGGVVFNVQGRRFCLYGESVDTAILTARHAIEEEECGRRVTEITKRRRYLGMGDSLGKLSSQ